MKVGTNKRRAYLLVISIGWLFFAACDAGRKMPENPVVTVIGSHQIRQDEFQWEMKRLKTACLDHFTKMYGAYKGNDFWQHSFQGITPANWLRERALQDLKKGYAQLEIMQQYGVLRGYGFDSLEVWWKRSNDLRKEKLTHGSIVYGTLGVNKEVFYTDLISRSLLAAKRRMAKQLNIPNGVLRKMYDRVKADRYKRAPTIMARLIQKTRSGESSSSQEVLFDPINRKSDELTWGVIYEMALRLKRKQQATAWFSDEENQDWKLECLDIRDNGFASFEEVLPLLKLEYAEQVFNAKVDSVLDVWQDGHSD